MYRSSTSRFVLSVLLKVSCCTPASPAAEVETEVEEEMQIEEGPTKVVKEEVTLVVAAKVRGQGACRGLAVVSKLVSHGDEG